MNTWLPIKQEYLIENFDNLLLFLAEADYTNTEDKFLIETIDKLEEAARNILTGKFSHLLGERTFLDSTGLRDLKIVAAAIYSSFKIDIDVRELLIKLLDTLIIGKIIDDSFLFEKVRNIVVRLANDCPIQALPYNIKDLMREDFNPKLFATKLLSIHFEEENTGLLAFETKGQCVFDNNKIAIRPQPSSAIKKDKLKAWVDAGLGVSIYSDEKGKFLDMDFVDQAAKLNVLVKTLEHSTPDPVVRLKEYTTDDVFFVGVKEIDKASNRVLCSTLDPAYKHVELELWLPVYHNFNSSIKVFNTKFIEHLEKGMILKVGIISKKGKKFFSFIDQLDEYYYDIEGFDVDVQQAIFIKEFAKGSTWLTEVGKHVNIMHDPDDESIVEAASTISPYCIEVRYVNVKEDRVGKKIINAESTEELIDCEDKDGFIKDAIDNIVKDLYDYWENQCPPYEADATPKPEPLDDCYVEILSHLLALRGDDIGLPFMERYVTTVAAASLAVMLDNSHDYSFCEYTLQFLKALWAFAEDMGNKWLKPVPVPEGMEGIDSVELKHKILEILCTYKENAGSRLIAIDNFINVDRVEHLVEASNTLIGNISPTEINRIKKTITQCLGIEALYKENPSDKFVFGEESDMLEFKTSVVFLPSRKGTESLPPDPNVQIWQILRTINGFLNSLHGGTLLLGVNDYGNATGVEGDIEWLYNHNMLLNNTIDRYIQFIKLRADNAFQAYRRNDKGREITSTRVQYTSFQTDGYTILRVDVLPYEMGCVKMVGNLVVPTGQTIKRPDFIKEAYVRNSIATEELTEIMRNKIEADKKGVIKDSEKQALISVQEAIENNKFIRLKNYQSASQVSDRTIAPIDLLPLRGLVIGVDKAKGDVRVFKLVRCTSVEVLNESFKPTDKNTYKVDPFNMLTSQDTEQFNIHLKLTRRAWLLLKEMHPYSENFLFEDNDKDYPYSLKCEVSDIRGIGSFCMSVLGSFKIEKGEQLDTFIKEQCSRFTDCGC